MATYTSSIFGDITGIKPSSKATGLTYYVSHITGITKKSYHTNKLATAIRDVPTYLEARSGALKNIDTEIAKAIGSYAKELAKEDLSESEIQDLIDKRIRELHKQAMEDFYITYPKDVYDDVIKYTKK